AHLSGANAPDDDDEQDRIDVTNELLSNMRRIYDQTVKLHQGEKPEFVAECLNKIEARYNGAFERNGSLTKELMDQASDPNSAWGLSRLKEAIDFLIAKTQREINNHSESSDLNALGEELRRQEKRIKTIIDERQEH